MKAKSTFPIHSIRRLVKRVSWAERQTERKSAPAIRAWRAVLYLTVAIGLLGGVRQSFNLYAAPNATPIAVDDSRLDQPLGSQVTINVVSNDIDADGNLQPSSVRLLNPSNLSQKLTRVVMPDEGVWQVNTSTGNVTFSPCTAAGQPDASCTQLLRDDPFPIEYTVKDQTGAESNPAIITITFDPNATIPPSIQNDSATTTQGQAVTINVLANDTDPDGTINSSSVTIVAQPSHGSVQVNSNGTIRYTPTASYTGSDEFTYRVCNTDSPPQCGTATVSITVTPPAANQPPIAGNDGPITVTYGQAKTINVLANDSDPENALDTTSVQVTLQPGHGSAQANANGTITYTPASGYSGNDQFTYKVCDSGSPAKCDTAIVYLNVLAPDNQAPTATNDSTTTQRDRAVTIAILANDLDPEGALNPASVTITANPSHGSVTINTTNGRVTYTPAAGYTGTDQFKYTVCDQGTPVLCSNAATVNITVSPPANQPPTAVNDNTSTPAGQAKAINVLSNDSDPEGALNPASVAVQTGPSNGSTSVNTTNGVITYTPNPGFAGTDTFTYKVCDSAAPPLCATATVTITVVALVNQPPTVVDDNVVTTRDTAKVINVLSNDSDSDGTLNPASVRVTAGPTSGTTAVNAGTGAITYTPNAGFTGTDSFTYEVCDDDDACDTAVVNITVNAPANQAPTAVNDNAVTQQNTAKVINVLSNDSDPDGALNPASVTVTGGPANGSASVNAGTGAVTYTPNTGFTGSDSFTYEVCDNGSPAKCDAATVSISILAPVNQPPTVVNDNAATTQDTAKIINVLGNDSDSDGTLNPASVTVTGGPANGSASVNAGTGAVTYTPAAGFTGSDSFTYQVCDDDGACNSATVSITVSPPPNHPPVAVNDSAATQQDTAVIVNALGNDSDSDGTLNLASVTVTGGPAGGSTTVNASTGAITYTPNTGFTGTDSFTYKVCDDDSACDTAVVTVTVNAAAGGNSILVVDDQYSGFVNQTISGNVLDNDSDPDGDTLQAPTVLTPPASGTLTGPDATGAFSYAPATDFIGNITFTYELCDDATPTPACDTAGVTITVSASPNLAPTAVDDEVNTLINQGVTIAVLDNDDDQDGTLVVGSLTILTGAQHGTATVNSGRIDYTPGVDYVGSDSLTYQICDDGTPQLCADATVNITVSALTNQSPMAVADTFVVQPDDAALLDVLANDVDPDGALVAATLAISVMPTNGSAVIVSGQIQYTPAAGYTGADSLTYQICDDGTPQACDTAQVTISVTAGANIAPIAVDDAAVVRAGQTVTIDVLSNDVDPDGSLVVATLRITGTAPASNAVVSDGKIEYTAAPTQTGSITFNYEICDDGNPQACDTAAVTVTIGTVANSAPVAIDDNAATLPNRPVTIFVLANDLDPDGALVPATLQIITPPDSGTAEITDSQITFTPATDATGVETFVYQICDDGEPQACDTATVTVTIITTSEENEAYAFDDAAYVRAGRSVTGNVLTNDLDPEEDGWQAPTVQTQPTQGSVTLAADGTFTYTANIDFTGSDSWTYEVCDLGAPPVCSSATVFITVAPPNTAPQAVNDSVVTRVDTPVSGNVLSNDLDADGDALSVEVTPVTPPASGDVTLTGDGQFTYTPHSGYTGRDSFEYRVCDPDGLCDTATVTINVRAADMANSSPYAVDDRAVTYGDTPVNIVVLANDGDLDGSLNPATVSIVAEAEQGTTTITPDGRIRYTPAVGNTDPAIFQYRICDNGDPILCATAYVTVEIVNPGDNTTYAFDDTVWGRAAEPIPGNVLENDLDMEGDTQSVNTTPSLEPNHGTLTLNADGSFTYNADAGYVGTDQFTYEVCDSGTPQACTMAMVYIHVFPPNLGWDFGDALGFPTGLTADGPRHAIVEGLSLGDVVDAEADGIGNSDATTDDVTNLNDEAVISVYPTYDGSGRYALDVPVQNATAYPAQLVGWIDWNVNFSFDDPGERSLAELINYQVNAAETADNTFVTGNVPAGYTGIVTLVWEDFAIPAPRSPAKLIRLRLAGNLPGSAPFFTDEGPSITGPATGGAVIDAMAPIVTQRVIVTSFTALSGEEEGNVNFAWVTALETQVAGFNILVERGADLVQVNGTLIPSKVTNSTTDTSYTYQAPVEGNVFYLQVVMLSGETFLYGPVRLNALPPVAAGPEIYLPLIRRQTDSTVHLPIIN